MSEIQSFERDIRDAKELIEVRKAALRLEQNQDFRRLFINGYFSTEAARMVQLSSDPALTEQQRADALDMAKATGHTKRYLSMCVQMGAAAERELPSMEIALDEARAAETEEAEGEED
jgi:hypothetical protein